MTDEAKEPLMNQDFRSHQPQLLVGMILSQDVIVYWLIISHDNKQ